MAYIPTLFRSRLTQAKIVSLLCITSLVATAYILAFIPTTGAKSPNRVKSKRHLEPESGPIHRYLNYLNGALSLACALNSITFREKAGVHDGFWVLCLLPVGRWCLSRKCQCSLTDRAVSFTVIILARQLMLSVDIDELEDLKYEYKGA